MFCSAQYGRSFALNDHIKSAHPDEALQEDEEVLVIEENMDAAEEVIVVVKA